MSDGSPTKAHLLRELDSLRNECQRLRALAIELERSRQTQKIIADLLMTSVNRQPLKLILERVIDQLTSIDWLAVESQGAVFLINEKDKVLEMAAWRSLSAAALKTCARVPLGRCLCGKAASSGTLIFADCIDERHEVLYSAITPHGHYCVPIISSAGAVRGVITLYIKEGHARSASEEHFLTTVAGALAGIIEFKGIAQALGERQRELEIKSRNVEDVNTALTVLLKKRQEDIEALENSIAGNLKMLVAPHLEHLRSAALTRAQRAHLEMLERNLLEITSPFAYKLAHVLQKLTPVELQVATMIKQGHSTKEIARLIHAAEQTVSVHRRNIRKKLQLSGVKANLRTHLLSLPE